ncbi:MAG TPA: hypothetical protein VK949_00715 [Methylotenera sp.]|nr:hypothetical protein [Methylotenera sp.]
MDIDDSSEKVRRNVLIFSFAIVVSSYLNLTFQKQGKIFSAIEFDNVSPFKFWIVITGVLIYLFYRYWFDTQTSVSIDLCKSEYSSLRYKNIKNILTEDIRKSFSNIHAPKYIDDFAELSVDHVKNNNDHFGRPLRVKSNLNIELDQGSPWAGILGIDYEIDWKEKAHYAKGGGYRYRYRIAKSRQILTRIKSLTRLSVYSKSISDLITPLLLTMIAFLICIKQLIHNWPLP